MLVGLGVFLVVAAALVRFYAYPALARVPAGYHSETALEATGAVIFNSDPEVLAPETHDLVITSKTSEDAEADVPDGDVVWVNATRIDKAEGGNFQFSTERVAFDAVTGAGVDCDACDTWEAVSDGDAVEEVPTVFEGQVYKFPFNTEKKTYDMWDGPTGEATPATFEGEESLQGLHVYKFVQVIEPTVVEQREVPGSVFGSKESEVEADMVYSMTRTFYVEPVTGSPVHRIEERVQELVYDGQHVPAFIGNVHYTDAQVDKNINDVETKASLLGGMRFLFPVGLLLVGLTMLAVGLLINRRQSAIEPGHHKEERPLVTA
ncbi:DUF3068 domain-containing protein [Nocardioides humilatus]|uniref:DUF3068 domain-containing protein n=1 Tax=Nocardioides humilatus TaxID=2607660 RepID=UPI001CB73EC5|nr:DUF3068 domain-containing protein [Nocardioides humilatus]